LNVSAKRTYKAVVASCLALGTWVSSPSLHAETSSSSAAAGNSVANQVSENHLKTQLSLDGIAILTGPSAASRDKQVQALLKAYESAAKNMGVDPTITLFMYEDVYEKDAAGKYARKPAGPKVECWQLKDGTKVIGFSFALMDVLSADNPPIARYVARLSAAIAHEQGHIANKDFETPNPPGSARIDKEYKADETGAVATCDYEAMIEQLQITTEALARRLGMTLSEYNYLTEHDPYAEHPPLPARIARLEYQKQHLPQSCKAIKSGL
jgi:Zn-dependent protease with chaperone function